MHSMPNPLRFVQVLTQLRCKKPKLCEYLNKTERIGHGVDESRRSSPSSAHPRDIYIDNPAHPIFPPLLPSRELPNSISEVAKLPLSSSPTQCFRAYQSYFLSFSSVTAIYRICSFVVNSLKVSFGLKTTSRTPLNPTHPITQTEKQCLLTNFGNGQSSGGSTNITKEVQTDRRNVTISKKVPTIEKFKSSDSLLKCILKRRY